MISSLRASTILLGAFLLLTAQQCGQDYRYSADTQVEISKTACFGQCPVYSFTLRGDGSATYNGKRFVDLEGAYQRTFAADTVNAVFEELVEADLYQYKDEYTEQVTDLPTTYLRFQHEGREKQIKLYYGFPQELEDIADRLQELAFTDGWSKRTANQ